MKSAFVCKHCGNPVGVWQQGDTPYWKHQRGWHSPPSCGRRLTTKDVVGRAVYERAS